MDLEDMVNLGQGFYAFVKYINRLDRITGI